MFGLPSLNVTDADVQSYVRDDSDVSIFDVRPRIDNEDAPNEQLLPCFVKSVDDVADERRGPRLLQDIYAHLDDVSVDDLLVEKSMLVKWLISRYEHAEFMRRPKDLMFAIVECVCTGIKIYLSTRYGDCRYVDAIEMFDGDIFCTCNEWMLGFMVEKRIADKPECHKEENQKTFIDMDSINIFEDEDRNDASTIELNNIIHTDIEECGVNDSLPPLFRLYRTIDNDGSGQNHHNAAATTTSTAEYDAKKVKLDIEKLKKYKNLNVDGLVVGNDGNTMTRAESNNVDVCSGDAKTTMTTTGEYRNVFRLIVDAKELERLLTFLLYVDRDALYDDIDVTFKNKLGTSSPYCFAKTQSQKNVADTCLANSTENNLKDLYEHVTRTDNLGTKHENDDCNNIENEECRRDDRALEIFEYITFLFLDKISTTVVEYLVGPSRSLRNNMGHNFKFGIVDLLHPKIGKIACNKTNAATPTLSLASGGGSSSSRHSRVDKDYIYNSLPRSNVSFV